MSLSYHDMPSPCNSVKQTLRNTPPKENFRIKDSWLNLLLGSKKTAGRPGLPPCSLGGTGAGEASRQAGQGWGLGWVAPAGGSGSEAKQPEQDGLSWKGHAVFCAHRSFTVLS